MTENNNLVARNKFISKLENKISRLSKALQLLSQVDDKLFINQTGGNTGFYSLGVNIAALEARAKAWEKAKSSTEALDIKLQELNDHIQTYQKKVNEILKDMPTADKNPLEAYLTLDSEGYQQAAAAFTAAYVFAMTTNNTEKTSKESELTKTIKAFTDHVDKTVLDDTHKKTIKDAFTDKIDEIKKQKVGV